MILALSTLLLGTPVASASPAYVSWNHPFTNSSTWLDESPINHCGTNKIGHNSVFDAKTGHLSFNLSQIGGVATTSCPRGGQGGGAGNVDTEVQAVFNSTSFVAHTNAWVVVRANWVLNWTVNLSVGKVCPCFLTQAQIFGYEYLFDLSTGVAWAPSTGGSGYAYNKSFSLDPNQTSLNSSFAGKVSMVMGAPLAVGDIYQMYLELGAQATVHSGLAYGPDSARVAFGPPGTQDGLASVSIR
jgi:hypothetical protein